MKKQLTGLIAAAMVFTMGACSAPPTTPTVTGADQMPTQMTLESVSNPETQSAKAGQALTEAELNPIRQLFEAEHSLYSQALTSYYEKPEDVDFREFFYNGHMPNRTHPETYIPPTDAEMNYLKELHGADHPMFSMDITVVSGMEMEEDLLAVFGLTADQTNRMKLDSFDYFPDTDRYFLFHGDTNALTAHITDGVWLSDTMVELHYLGGFNEVCTIVMEQRNDRWYILSNLSSSDLCGLPTSPTE